MLRPKEREYRDINLGIRLSKGEPICLTDDKFADLARITLRSIDNCNSTIGKLESLLREPEPDYSTIRCTANSCIAAIQALLEMRFVEVLTSGGITQESVYDFLKVRIDLLYRARGSFQSLIDEIPLEEKNDELIVEYLSEKTYAVGGPEDICFILDRNVPGAKKAIENALSTSDISFFVKNVMAEPFCCPNCTWDDTTDYYFYDIYTIAIVSFWNPVKKEDILAIFPDAFIPEDNFLYEYFDKYFSFESLFRRLPTYDNVKQILYKRSHHLFD